MFQKGKRIMLEDVLNALHEHEIDVSIVARGKDWHVKLGQSPDSTFKNFKAEKSFDKPDGIAAWLCEQALEHYPVGTRFVAMAENRPLLASAEW